jgi:hypothetical protein
LHCNISAQRHSAKRHCTERHLAERNSVVSNPCSLSRCLNCPAECRSSKCHFGECCGAKFFFMKIFLFRNVILLTITAFVEFKHKNSFSFCFVSKLFFSSKTFPFLVFLLLFQQGSFVSDWSGDVTRIFVVLVTSRYIFNCSPEDRTFKTVFHGHWCYGKIS